MMKYFSKGGQVAQFINELVFILLTDYKIA